MKKNWLIVISLCFLAGCCTCPCPSTSYSSTSSSSSDDDYEKEHEESVRDAYREMAKDRQEAEEYYQNQQKK